ncbi:MAG: pre-peptidase C-terminal domain-containing protein [Ardenticatenia bacterium]|nr:pre-peptidase C-terminal domain-containing protein [Ardenticatenia bacterium]
MPWDATSVPDQRGIAFYTHVWDTAGNSAGNGVWNVTLDRAPPQVFLQPLDAVQESTLFSVFWEVSDETAGAGFLDLQIRQDGGEWQDLVTNVDTTQYQGVQIVGDLGRTYSFRARAVDWAGNRSSYPTAPQAETFINTCQGDDYESDDSPSSAALILPYELQSHTFCGTYDEDWFLVQARAGYQYIIETGALSDITDTVLSLFADDGLTLLDENDDISPGNLASRIEWTANSDGWYYVRARAFDGSVAGNAVTYSIWLEEYSPYYKVYLPVTTKQ